MRFVLDTHTFLYYIRDDPRLSSRAATLLEDTGNEPTLSVGSLFEISIKVSVGKLSIGAPMTSFVAEKLEAVGIDLLPITPVHLDTPMTLPFHHRDPFDRPLVAQCLAEDISVLSRDGACPRGGGLLPSISMRSRKTRKLIHGRQDFRG